MDPLDLRHNPPRSPRDTLLGLYFLPRTIDKIRGEFPGGALGTYFVDHPRGMSAYVLHKIGVQLPALRAVVAEAKDDSDVAAWLEKNADLSGVAELNARISNLTVGMMPTETRAFFDSVYDGAEPVEEDDLVFDVIERDDAKLAFGVTVTRRSTE